MRQVHAHYAPDVVDLIPGYAAIAKSALMLGGFLFAMFGVAHLFVLPSGLREIMFTVAFASSALAVGVRLAILKGRLAFAFLRYVPVMLIGLGLLNSSIHFWLSENLLQSTNLSIVVIAAGILLLEPLQFVAVALAVVVSWCVGVYVLEVGDASSIHYGIFLAESVLFAAATFLWKRRVFIRNFQLRRDQYQARTAEHHSLLSAQAKAIEAERNFRKALEADASKSMFLANMSHELRTPLNSVVGFAQLLRDRPEVSGNPALVAEYAECIQTSGTHLLNLINQILDFSRANAGVIRLAEVRVDVGETLSEIAKQLTVQAQEAGVTLAVSELRAPVIIAADDLRVRQVFTNILANAIKFTPSGGRVDVSVVSEGDGVSVLFRDTGVGIALQDQARIFEPFIQVENGLDKTHQGTGLGLPICKKLIELHGGTIGLKSVLGEGTVVTVQFPASRTLANLPKKAAHA